MRSAHVVVLGCLLLGASVQAQEQPRELKGGGHVLGESAEQFFSVGSVGELVRACEKRDWKAVKFLVKSVDKESKTNPKEICDKATTAKHQAINGARQEYSGSGSGDMETMRTDAFVLDGGRLVKIRMIYATPMADIEGFHPKSFEEIFAGLREAYGEPSDTYSEPVVNAYGVKRDAHRAIWFGKENVISLVEQLGEHGRTEIIAETLEEYKREAQAPKTANPLH